MLVMSKMIKSTINVSLNAVKTKFLLLMMPKKVCVPITILAMLLMRGFLQILTFSVKSVLLLLKVELVLNNVVLLVISMLMDISNVFPIVWQRQHSILLLQLKLIIFVFKVVTISSIL